MATSSKSVHQINLQKLNILITELNKISDIYRPKADNLRIESLQKRAENLIFALEQIEKLTPDHKIAIKARQEAFKDLSKLTLMLNNAAQFSNIHTIFLSDINKYHLRISGKPYKNKIVEIDGMKEKITVAQQSYYHLLENYRNIYYLLEQLIDYKPLIEEISLENLKKKLDNMTETNRIAVRFEEDLDYYRKIRDNILYEKRNSITELLPKIQEYVQKKCGDDNEIYKAIAKLKFNNKK